MESHSHPEHAADDMVIRFEHVRKAFGKQQIFRDLSLQIRRGEIIALVGSIPKWPHSKGWGYFPSLGLGLVLLVLLILAIMHRL